MQHASRYLQTTVASKEGGYLPDPYEANEIFDIGSLVKEFQDHYEALDLRRKLCSLCFAIFPENAEVCERLLGLWWIGERLSPEKENAVVCEWLLRLRWIGEKSSRKKEKGLRPEKKEEKGLRSEKEKGLKPEKEEEKELRTEKEKGFVKETLGKFVDEGFIEPINKKKGSRATSYKMHPIIRALIIKLAKKANFFDYDPKGKPTMDISKSKKTCLVKSAEASWFSKKVPNSMEHQRDDFLAELQTLINVSTQFPELPEELLSKMINIGVLNLGRRERTVERHIEVENSEFFEGLTKNMKKLCFFSLQGISGISKLPKSVCKLSNLRILDLRACYNLEKLPKEIGSLKKLTHLDLSECYLLDIVPKELKNLSELRVLKGFVINKISSCELDHLTELRNLEKLSINVNNDDFSITKAGDVFSKLKELKKLKITWGAGASSKSTKGNNGTQKDIDKSNGKDQKKQEKNPQRVDFTLKLVKLDFQCFPEREPPSWLVPQKLTSLKRLSIKGGLLSNLPKSSEEKWNVDILRLKFLRDFKASWNELRAQFRNLKHLEKVNCPQITFCPCDANGVWMSKQP